MNVDVKKLDRGEVELTITIAVAEYQPFLDKAVQDISKNVNTPGFRPGKAGYDVIKQRVGEGAIWEQALEPAVQKTFVQAITEHTLVTVGSPKIDVVTLAPGSPVVYKAVVSILPEVTLVDYTTLKVANKPVVVSDAEINKTLDDLRKMRSAEALVDREAKKGDKVEIGFEVFMDNIPIENGTSTKYPLVIGEGAFIPGFEEQLVGMKADDKKEFTLSFPKEYHAKNLAGKPATFKVTVNAVYELTVPELNEAFAKELGFESVEKLNQQVKENLTHEAKHNEEHRLEEEMIEQLVKKSSFEPIPDILVTGETKKMLEELQYNLKQQHITIDDYLAHLKKTRDELMLDFVPQATNRVKGALATRKVAEQANIQVSDQEIENEISATLARYGGSPEAEKQFSRPEYKEYLRNILTSRKVMATLKAAMVDPAERDK